MQLNSELQQIVSLVKLNIDYFDALRPIVLKNFNVDLFDLVFFEADSPISNSDPISYTGSDTEWSFSDNTSEISFSSSDNNFNDHLTCRNDVSMHQDFHYCHRKCSGASFICGCTYLNSSGSWTKCGFISYSSEHRHPCIGHPDHHFKDSRPDSHTDYTPKGSRSSKNIPNNVDSDWSTKNSYLERYHRKWDDFDYDF